MDALRHVEEVELVDVVPGDHVRVGGEDEVAEGLEEFELGRAGEDGDVLDGPGLPEADHPVALLPAEDFEADPDLDDEVLVAVRLGHVPRPLRDALDVEGEGDARGDGRGVGRGQGADARLDLPLARCRVHLVPRRAGDGHPPRRDQVGEGQEHLLDRVVVPRQLEDEPEVHVRVRVHADEDPLDGPLPLLVDASRGVAEGPHRRKVQPEPRAHLGLALVVRDVPEDAGAPVGGEREGLGGPGEVPRDLVVVLFPPVVGHGQVEVGLEVFHHHADRVARLRRAKDGRHRVGLVLLVSEAADDRYVRGLARMGTPPGSPRP